MRWINRCVCVWSLLFVVAVGMGFAEEDPVRASLVANYSQVEAGQEIFVAAYLKMAPHWHTYAKDPGDSGFPTHIEWTLPEGVTAGEIQWPEHQRFEWEGLVNYGYEDEVYLWSTLHIPETWPVGDPLHIQAKVTWLACKDVCLPGEASLMLNLPVAAEARLNEFISSDQWPMAKPLDALIDTDVERSSKSKIGFFLAVLLAFIGGLILNLMPCVLPVISLKVLNFVKHASDAPHTVWRHGVVFTVGILVSFWSLVAVLMALRAGGAQLGWGFQLQSPIFVAVLILFLFVFALNMFGVFEVGGSLGRLAHFTQGRGIYMESFMSGVLATIVATPCTAPFMGPALGFALTQPPYLACVVFTALALGLASPYLVLSLNPKWMRLIPKPGSWMVTLKQFMGFPLLATSLWLLWVLSLQTDAAIVLKVLAVMIVIALALWAHGRCHTKKTFIVGLIVMIISAQWLISGISQDGLESVWQPFDEQKIVEYRKDGEAVFVDFTAAWCLTCQVNKKTTLHRKDTLALFAKHNVVLMKADWTKKDARITKVLESFGRSGVPLYVYYSADLEKDPQLLPSVLTPQMIIDVLE